MSEDNCPRLGYYAANSGISLPAFRDYLSVPSSRFSVYTETVSPVSTLLIRVPKKTSLCLNRASFPETFEKEAKLHVASKRPTLPSHSSPEKDKSETKQTNNLFSPPFSREDI
jgi:membrane carboxypeptidase/penicillin-binding protein